MIQLTLPWPPTVNRYWTPNVFRGRFVGMRTTKDATAFRHQVLVEVRRLLGPVGPKLAKPVRVDVELRAPDRRRRDIDNHLKGLFDALTHADVWLDDSQVDELTVRRGRVTNGGMAVVLISELDAETTP